jgi:E3 ubiquitin-protein ligase SHPRH
LRSYFKQLQELSDSVATIETEKPIDEEIADCEADVTAQEKESTSQKGKLNYLVSLADQGDDEDDECIICTSSYEQGWIFEW